MSGHLRQPVTGPRSWRSADFDDDSDWLTAIDDAGVEALVAAAAVLPDDPHRWVDLDADDVITDAVGDAIAGVASDLWHGKGYFWLRGLPADDPELLRRLFWVIGNNLGVPTMQNKRGQVLSEVFDRFGGAERVVDTRGYESSDELTFHCDGGDSIGLACVRPAPTGGQNGLVSMAAIYNELLANQPEHLDVLERGFGLYSRQEASSDGSVQTGGTATMLRVFGDVLSRLSASEKHGASTSHWAAGGRDRSESDSSRGGQELDLFTSSVLGASSSARHDQRSQSPTRSDWETF